ncbi:MAG: hypothetical protein ACRDTO_00760 [Mycobacterium sp.]
MVRKFLSAVELPGDPASGLQATTRDYVTAQDALRAPVVHTHAEGDVTGLVADLAARAGYAVNSPATAAGADWVVTHNLGSQDVIVMVRRAASPYDCVPGWIGATSTTTVTVKPDIALAVNEYRAVVIRAV